MSHEKSPAKNTRKSMKSRVAIFAILLLTATASIILYRTQAATSDPDPTFLSAGKVSLNLPGNNNDYAEAVAIQTDGKVVVGGTDNDFRIVRYNTDGNLDQTFGTNGVATIDFGATESLYDIAIQADGKIVAVGAGNIQTTDRYFAVVRLNTNGTLDTSFDGDGKANINTLAGGSDYPSSVAIQADQKIVVAGNTEPSGLDTIVIRVNTNGTLDTSFDGDGVKTYSLSGGTDYANDVVIQSDQKIVLGGLTHNGSNLDFAVSRLNPDGSFDTSFDGDGIATTGITSSDDRILKLALQTDGKIVASGYSLVSGANNDFVMARFNTNGSLDTTFDGDGRVQTDFGLGRDDVGRKIDIQADGKIVMVGETNTVNGSRYDYGLVRYNTDGSLDTTFDGDGKLTAQFNANNSISTDVAVQTDGKFVVVGRSNWQTVDFGAMRFNPNGTLDTTWGAGKINLDLFNGTADEGRAVARQADGKLIVVGRYLNGSNFAIAVSRYNANGTIDTTFGSGGKVTTQINSTYPQAVALQADGKIVVAGFNFTGANYDFLLVRYNSNGALDSSFDGDGIATLNVTVADLLYGVAIQPDGKIVAVGTLISGSDQYVLLRYNTDGSLDTTFDGDGRVTTDITGGHDAAYSVVIQPDGKIVAAGFSTPSTNDFSVARYNTNGSLDTSFNGVGYAIVQMGSAADVVHAVVLQPDGKIVVAGNANGGASADDFALARFNTNGTLDTSFDIDGKLTTSFSNSNDQAFGVVIQPDGKILMSGHAYNGHTNDFAFARYNADGSPDNTFNGNGRLFLDFSGYNDSDANITGNNMILQPDGKAVVVSTASNGINTDIGIARITLENPSPGSIQFNNTAYFVNETTNTATITVVRSGGLGTVTVDYATSNGTATAGADYTDTTGTLTFNEGESLKTFTIPILDDLQTEGNETVNLTLSNATGGATLGAQTTAILTIIESGEAAILGGSNLINQTQASQIAGYLNEGNIVLTNIFSKTAGDSKTSTTFHNAVNGMGRTITVIRVQYNSQQYLIGGYNPQSWDSSGTYHITANNSDRKAFLFNLPADIVQSQKLNTEPCGSDAGQHQTYNHASYGPTFGGGHDIYIDSSLESGYVHNYSYGTSCNSNNILNIGAVNHSVSYLGFEVFTIAAGPVLSINDVIVSEPVSGSVIATFNVALSHQMTSTVTVDYTTADGTATAVDYGATSGTLTFLPGETTKTISVTVVSDLVTEGIERFFVNLSNAANATIADAQGVGTIFSPYNVNGKIAFIRILSPNNQIFTMNADGSNQTDLSNIAQDDLQPAWSPDGSKIAFLSTRGNNGDIYTMNSDGSNQTRLTNAVDADQAPGWSPDGMKIAFTSYRDNAQGEIYVMDANGANQTRLTSNSSVDYAPKFSPDGTKIVFYTNRDGSYEIYSMDVNGSNQTRLTNNTWDDQFPNWSPDGTKITFHSVISGIYRVSVMNADGSGLTQITNASSNNLFPSWSPDGSKIVFTSERDGNREIYTMNTNGSNQTRLTNNAVADYAPAWQPQTPLMPGSLQFSSATYSVNENGVTATITVTRTGGSDGAVSVDYATSNGTASSGSDFTNNSGTLNWGDGDSADKTFTVSINDDGTFEGNETVNLSLGNVLGGAVIGAPSTAVLTILDNETQPTVSINDVSIVEGDSGTSTAIFTVSLSNPTTQTVTVDFSTANGTATAGSDYVSASGTLTFNPLETNKPINVTINGDTLVESNEAFGVQIISTTNSTIADGNGEGTITNDDAGGTMEFSSATYSVNEANTTATITVTRTGGAASGVTVDYLTSDGTATTPDDYTTAFGQITFDAGETSKTFDVTILDDNIFESNETVNLTLSNPQGGGSLGTQTTAVLTINETDTCSYQIAPTSQNFGYAGGNNSVGVTVITGCTWTAVSNDAWISVTGGSSGNGNGTVSYSVAANNGLARTGTITVAGQTFTVTQDAGCLNVSVPTGLTALKNSTLTVPVNVNDTSGRGVLSFDFTLTYDPAVLTPLVTPFDTASTLSSGYTITFNSSTPGTLIVSGFGTTALTGTGTLINLKFNVIGNPADCSNLNLSSFQFNEGTPCVVTTNGQACVINGTISGNVIYVNGMPTQHPVKNVTLTAVGATTITGTTDNNGDYAITGFANGAYTVTPTKSGDANGITAFDASLNAQHVVSLITLNANQQIAADVSNNGTLSSFDSALIAQYVVSIPNPGITGTWKFVPASRSYANVIADQPNQNYDAILMGEISGNWTPPTSLSEPQKQLEDTSNVIGVSLPDQPTTPNSNVTVPITVQDTTGKGVVAYEFDLTYDPNILQLQPQPVDNAGTLSNGMLVTVNAATAGLIKVAVFGTTPMNGAGSLLKLKFTAIGSVGSISPLTWTRFMFNENTPQNVTTNGQVRIAQPTAAAGDVCGIITNQSGKPLEGVIVKLYEAQTGEGAKTVTNAKGSYCFDSVVIGVDYVIQPFGKGYEFTPSYRLLTLQSSRDDIDFVATPIELMMLQNEEMYKSNSNTNKTFFRNELNDFFLMVTQPNKHPIVWRDGNLSGGFN